MSVVFACKNIVGEVQLVEVAWTSLDTVQLSRLHRNPTYYKRLTLPDGQVADMLRDSVWILIAQGSVLMHRLLPRNALQPCHLHKSVSHRSAHTTMSLLTGQGI